MQSKLEAIYWNCYGKIPTGRGRRPVAFKDVDIIAYIWQNYKLSEREKDFLFRKVSDKYLNFMYSKLKYDTPQDKEEVIQNYRVMVHYCLESYTGKNKRTGASAKFNTYLFFSIKRVVPNYFNEEKQNGRHRKIKNIPYDPNLFDEVACMYDFVDNLNHQKDF